MSVSFQIFPTRGLVYVRYDGFVDLNESLAAFGDYMRHPDCKPGQKQLVDLSAVTGFERDFSKMLKMQATKVDLFSKGGVETLIVYYAPSRMAQDMARLIVPSWEPFDGVVPLIQDSEANALALLGQREDSFDAFLVHAD